MNKIRYVICLLFIGVCILLNLISPVYAQNLSSLLGISAGVGCCLDGSYTDVNQISAGVDRVQDLGTVNSVVDDKSVNFNSVNFDKGLSKYFPVVLDEEDPLYKLFGNDIVMSNVTDSVNVRKEPSEDAELVGKLYHNCAGKKLDTEGDWTKISSGGFEGWIKDDYLVFGEEAVNKARQVGSLMAVVNAETLRIRESADENSAVYGLLAQGEEITVIEDSGDWIKVAYSDDTEGYVAGEFVKLEYSIDQGESIAVIKAREEAEKARKEAERKEAERKAKKSSSVKANRTTNTVNTNNGGVAAKADDVTLLAALIQAECGREPYAGKLAVGAVVVNRARGRYGSIYNAIYAPGQFGPAANGKVAAYVAVGPSAECRKAAAEAISGVSNVGAATHFRNIRSNYTGIVIGNHVFW